MQQVLADTVKLIVIDSRLAFMQGRYEESLRLAKQALDMDKNADFDSVVNPSSVKKIKSDYNSGRTGMLDDGSRITVRKKSSDGRPTLELRKKWKGNRN